MDIQHSSLETYRLYMSFVWRLLCTKQDALCRLIFTNILWNYIDSVSVLTCLLLHPNNKLEYNKTSCKGEISFNLTSIETAAHTHALQL